MNNFKLNLDNHLKGEANARSKSIVEYMPNNKAAIGYRKFTREVLNLGSDTYER